MAGKNIARWEIQTEGKKKVEWEAGLISHRARGDTQITKDGLI